MKAIFCPKCHKRIMPSKFIGQVKMEGNMKLRCGDQKCSGVAIVKPTKN